MKKEMLFFILSTLIFLIYVTVFIFPKLIS